MPQENKNGAGAESAEKTLEQPETGANAGGGTGQDGNGQPGGNDGEGGEGDEEVTIKKSELSKLKKAETDNDNYQKALGIGKYKKAKAEDKGGSDTTRVDTSQFVTKKEQQIQNQKKAIKLATTVAESDEAEVAKVKKDLDEHWDEIKAFYANRRGSDTPEDIVEDLFDAHALWSRKNKGKTADDDKGAKSHLATDRGTGGKASGAENKGTRTRVLPKKTAPSDWYPKKQA